MEDAFPGVDLVLLVAAAAGTSIAVYNIGTMPFCQEGSFKRAFIGALIGEVVEWSNLQPDADFEGDGSYVPDNPKRQAQAPLCGIILSILFFRYTRSYRSLAKQQRIQRSRPGPVRRMMRLSGKLAFIWVLIISGVYWNGEIDSEDSGRVRIKHSIEQIRNSPAWAQFKGAAWTKCGEAYSTITDDGWEAFWQKFTEALDVDGTQRAYLDLELPEDPQPTQEEIKKAARALQKRYHPDRCKLAKEECEDKFQRVQAAFELLHDRAHKRKDKNQKSRRRKERG